MLAERIAVGSTEGWVPGYVAVIFVNLGGGWNLGAWIVIRCFGDSCHFGKV